MRFTLVDGHSLIHAWPDLRRLHARRMAAAREELIRRLTAYQDFSEERVVVVFDGKGERLSDESAPAGIQVLYAAGGQTADGVIERLVAAYAQEHELTVVTDDLMEQQTVSAFGALTMGSESFKQFLGETRTELDRALKKRRPRF